MKGFMQVLETEITIQDLAALWGINHVGQFTNLMSTENGQQSNIEKSHACYCILYNDI